MQRKGGDEEEECVFKYIGDRLVGGIIIATIAAIVFKKCKLNSHLIWYIATM